MLNREINEYNHSLKNIIKGSLTRAIVVSNRDPLFSGRVKVWIPAIHGTFPNEFIDTAEDSENKISMPDGAKYINTWKASDVEDLLPWAKPLSQNWGPKKNENEVATISGIFSTPKKGTEVYVIFENDDPNLPILVGGIIHTNEFKYEKDRPLEIIPGLEVTEQSIKTETESTTQILTDDEDDYLTKVANAFSIRAENKSMLYISDTVGESAIFLSGQISLEDIDTLTTTKYSKITAAYPGFPTTASAAFAKRVVLSKDAVTLTVPSNTAYQAPTDSLALSEALKETLPAPVAEATPEKTTPVDTHVIKMWPIKPGAGRATPPLSGDPTKGNFGSYRSYYRNNEKRHMGIDISAATDNSTICVAPIDMYPVTFMANNKSMGNALFCRAVDGTGHGFFHLAAISNSIVKIMQNHAGTLIKAGTPLGWCGNTGHVFGNNGGYHLHWEIFKGVGETIDANSLLAIRNRAQVIGTSAFYNPLEWMGSISTPTTIIQGTPEQIRSYIDHNTLYANSGDVNFSKPIGLEISTVPGQETVYLRHPSGAFIGFDVDGNFQVYTPGDENHRVNRSVNWDVLGGILESCYAKFSRIKTVTRTWSKIYSKLRNKDTADNSFPDFFRRAEEFRKIDMSNAVRSTLGNAFYVNKDSSPIKILNAYSDTCRGIATAANTTARSFGLTTYDSEIQNAYNTYITGELAQVFPDWKYFKAQMLLESNGDPKASSGGTIGLFQIGPSAVEEVKGMVNIGTTAFNYYFDPHANIDLGIQFMTKCYYYTKKAIENRNSRINNSTPFSEIDKKDIRNICFLVYNVGSGEVRRRISDNIEQTVTYPAVEASYKASHQLNTNIQAHLEYVPTLNWIYSHL